MKTDFKVPVLLSASTINGTPVVNEAGEDLGKIEDTMVDLTSGRIAYAVLSFGGLLGLGNKFFAIPWEALYVNTEEENILLNVDKETLENAPGFDKDNWPDQSDHTWLVQVYEFYGYHPYWR